MGLGNPGVNCNPTYYQIGTDPKGGLGNTGYQTNYCNAQVLDSYRVGSDFIASDNEGLGNLGTQVNQVGTRFRGEPSNTDNLYRFSGDKVLNL